MALLGLKLDGLLGNITDVVDDLLGDGAGNVLKNILPGGLVGDLGESLNDLLGSGGDPTGLLADLVDNNVLDLAMLQDMLGSNGNLDLSSIGDLLSGGGTDHLKEVLDGVFDKDGILGLGNTILDPDALGELGPVDLAATVELVTALIASILDVAGTGTNVNDILDSLLATNDTLNGSDAGNTIDGRNGNDTINGMGGDDTLHGGVGNDSIHGGVGDDRIYGDDGNDVLFGDDGKDILQGGKGDDVMRGGLGDDIYYVDSTGDSVTESANQGVDIVYSTIKYALGANVEGVRLIGTDNINAAGNSLDNTMWGNDATNKLSGGGGRDVLYGKGGKDVLDGGSGNDVFRYVHESDSVFASKGRDVILDFSHGDKLDFRNVDANTHEAGDQAFEFIGRSQFHGDGQAEIRYSFNSKYAIVSVDIDGDGTTDMAVQLNGVHKLSVTDFQL